MITGRAIRIKSEPLRKIRTNLRKLFYTALGDQYDHLMDQAELQSSVGNQSGGQRLHDKSQSIYDLLFVSICRCHRCNSFEKDAVFWSEEIYYPMYHPPVSVEEKPPKTYWLCPECYEISMSDFKHHKNNEYYYFHKVATFASLKELGFKTLEEYDLDRKKQKK
jgi:hypothetical protein